MRSDVALGPRAALALSLAGVLSVTSACSTDPERTADEPPGETTAGWVLLPGEGFGPLRLQETSRAQAEELLGPPERELAGAWEYLSEGFALGFDREDQRLVSIFIGGPPELAQRFRGRTAEGIGISSELDEIVAAYGDPDQIRPVGESVEALYYWQRGITFEIGEDGVHRMVVLSPREVPKQAEES